MTNHVVVTYAQQRLLWKQHDSEVKGGMIGQKKTPANKQDSTLELESVKSRLTSNNKV